MSYVGTQYNGWQRQSNTDTTIQQIVEEALTKVLKTNCIVSGCGRTDAGVHASQFYFHLDLKKEPEFDLCKRMNLVLPIDISFIKLFHVPENGNARFDATQRTYNYFFHSQPNPFLNALSTCVMEKLDMGKMKSALNRLNDVKDFRYFCLQPDKHKSTICKGFNCSMYLYENESRFRIEITANRFLRGMIRILMNRLFAVGAGNISEQDFMQLISGAKIEQTKSAPPQGLYLSKLQYDFIDEKEIQETNPFLTDDKWVLVH